MVSEYKIQIKGMVCDRCISAVREALQELHVPVTDVRLGEVTTVSALTAPDMEAIRTKLAPLGFDLVEDKRTKLVREVKMLVEQVYSGEYDFPQDFRFSDVVVKHFIRDYSSISQTFSAVEGITLEKYIMEYRVEKVKELLVYTSEPLSAIAFRLGFSSAAHLSRQFRSVTGLNASHFREMRREKEASRRQS